MTIDCQFFDTPLHKKCANLKKRLALSIIYIIMCQTYCNPYILAFCSLIASS